MKNTVDQLINDIQSFRSLRMHGNSEDQPPHENELISYLLANGPVIESFLHLAFDEHTADERKQLSEARDHNGNYVHSVSSSGITGLGYEVCARAVTHLAEFVKAEMVNIADDDLDVLIRGLQYARCFEVNPVTTPLQHSPVEVTQ